MNRLIQWSLANRVFVLVAGALLILFGVYIRVIRSGVRLRL